MKSDSVLREYVCKLSDEDLDYVAGRLGQKLFGDVADALTFCSQCPEVDRVLKDQSSSEDFYNTLDTLEFIVDKEVSRRRVKTKKSA